MVFKLHCVASGLHCVVGIFGSHNESNATRIFI